MVAVAMVLAAGFGTRLAPLTEELPKPLVPVGDRSVLAHVIDAIAAAGIERAVVNAHHHADLIAAEATRMPLEVAVSREAEILGTAGGVAQAGALLGPGPVLLHNGDILADLDLAALVRQFHARRPFALLGVVRGRPPGDGNVGLARDRVVRLRDRSFGEEDEAGGFVGVQVLSAEARAALPATGCLVGDCLLPALARGARIEVAPVRRFDDIGTPAAYLAANLRWLAGRRAHAAAPVPPAVMLHQTVVGAGALIEGAGTIARTVVWPGAVARAPLEDAIVTPRRVLERVTGS